MAAVSQPECRFCDRERDRAHFLMARFFWLIVRTTESEALCPSPSLMCLLRQRAPLGYRRALAYHHHRCLPQRNCLLVPVRVLSDHFTRVDDDGAPRFHD